MPEQRLFHAPNLDINHLSMALADWYRGQRFDIQLLEAPGGGVVLQARQEEAWRSVLGMSATLNILMRHQQDGNLVVEIGAGKWIDKAAAAGVGMFILWPMLITAGYGAWQQGKLPQRTFEFIQNFIATGGSISADMAVMQAAQLEQARRVVGGMSYAPAPGMAPAPPMYPSAPAVPAAMPQAYAPQQPAPPPAPAMPGVGQGEAIPGEAAPSAGVGMPAAEPSAAPRFCANCGGRLPDGARFCPGCGGKVG
jgi:hypothetical protein